MPNGQPGLTRFCLQHAAALTALLLTACADVSVAPSRLPALLNHDVFHVPDVELQAVSPEMQAFLEHYVSGADSPESRAWNLVWATTDRSILPFKYQPELTLTSTEAFALRKGNCLAFSNMLIAMARSQGLKAWYQEVEVPPKWSSTNNIVMVSMHVNVVLQGRIDDWIVDISRENVSSSRRVRRISDQEALAQHYNNLGADALTEEDLARAYAYYAKAIATMPRLPYLWSNLGVVYNRNGQTEDARRAYLEALRIDPAHSTAANNLFLIYQREGNLAAAQELQARVERHRRRNPYYLYFLSSQAADQGNYEESMAILEKAIRLNDSEYRFHYELARIQALSGDRKAAQASLERALQLAPDGSPISGASLENLPDLPE
jgi:tetratricopeptide (TPR) repeat protein